MQWKDDYVFKACSYFLINLTVGLCFKDVFFFRKKGVYGSSSKIFHLFDSICWALFIWQVAGEQSLKFLCRKSADGSTPVEE